MVEDLLKRIEICESKIDYENYRDNYLDKLVHSYPILSLDEEKELFKLFSTTKDKTYKDIIFKCHLREVHDTCKDTSGYRSDLISEGIVLLYDFITEYDYEVPYTTFTDQLIARLTILYSKKISENDKSLDTEMSTQELAGLEQNGKCLTSESEEEKVVEETPKEELIIVINEGIEIVPKKETKPEKDITQIYTKLFGEPPKPKKLTKRYRPPIDPGELGF